MAATITHTIQQKLAVLSAQGETQKLLTVTAWNGNAGKLDLRAWRTEGGELRPNKGITLTDDEAQTLLEALQAYFSKK